MNTTINTTIYTTINTGGADCGTSCGLRSTSIKIDVGVWVFLELFQNEGLFCDGRQI
jgi:hypothetical protein